MRSIYLLQLTILAAVAAGCRSEVKEQPSASAPQRDLTLIAQASPVNIASAVETERPRIARRAVRPRRAPVTAHLAGIEAGSAPVRTPGPAAQPAPTAPIPANDRELLPGTTVTLIPASSGPSAGPDEASDLPAARGHAMVGRGGGRCRGGGRGLGTGIAGAPRPDFR